MAAHYIHRVYAMEHALHSCGLHLCCLDRHWQCPASTLQVKLCSFAFIGWLFDQSSLLQPTSASTLSMSTRRSSGCPCLCMIKRAGSPPSTHTHPPSPPPRCLHPPYPNPGPPRGPPPGPPQDPCLTAEYECHEVQQLPLYVLQQVRQGSSNVRQSMDKVLNTQYNSSGHRMSR